MTGYLPTAPADVYDAACRAWDGQTVGSSARLLAAVDAAYERGVAAGRKQAAADALMAARDDLALTADRLRTKARDSGDRTHLGTAAGVSLACFRLVELADRATRAEGGEPRG
jgi:hypothetical protein